MKPVNIKLTPSHGIYPTLTKTNVTDLSTVIEKIYHGKYPEYTLEITSDWYDSVKQNFSISKDMSIDVNLVYSTKTINFIVNPVLPTKAIDGVNDDQYTSTNAIVSFADQTGKVSKGVIGNITPVPLQIHYSDKEQTVTVSKKFYETATKSFLLMPDSDNDINTVNIDLVRKIGIWIREIIETQTVKKSENITYDVNQRPSYRVITKEGSNGVRTLSQEYEYIDSEKTALTRGYLNEITTPAINDEVTIGSGKVEWKANTKTEVVNFTEETYESFDYLEGTRTVTTPGQNGEIVYNWEDEYLNDTLTGIKRNETSETTKNMVVQKVAIGVRPLQFIVSINYKNVINPKITATRYYNSLDTETNGFDTSVKSLVQILKI